MMSPQIDKSREFNVYRNYYYQVILKLWNFITFDPINPHNIPVR